MNTSNHNILSLDDIIELTDDELIRLRSDGFQLPLVGAEGEDDDDDNPDGGSGDDEEELDDPTANDDGDDDEPADPDEGTENVSKAELNRLKRIAAESDAARKKAEREAKRRKEKEQRDNGQWQDLLDERDEKINELEAERDEARYNHDQNLREGRVTKAANRLGFKDPSDAFRFLAEDETDDDASTERGLKRLAKEKPYLVEKIRSSGIPVNGEAGGLTHEEIKKMSTEQINARWTEVQAALAAGS
jgi:hypothetical protein